MIKKTKINLLILSTFSSILSSFIFFKNISNSSSDQITNFYKQKQDQIAEIKISNKQDLEYYSLRDEYILFNQYQVNTGLCWDFASIKSLETALMLANNEMYDFSEASISVLNEHWVADGGFFRTFDNLLNRNGIAFESDFRFGDLYYFPNTGTYYNKLLDLYKSKYITNLSNKLEAYSFYRYSILDNLKQIKEHISKHSALFVGIDHWQVVKNKVNKQETFQITSGSMGAHAVSIIGWDDNYINNDNSKGAFIVLNSDGFYDNNDGVNYLPYNSSTIYLDLQGYKFIGDKLISSKGINSSIKNKYFNYYNTKLEKKYTETKPLNQNIFSWDDQVEIQYQLNDQIADFKRIQTSIFYDKLDVSDKFEVKKVDNKILIKAKQRIRPGSYTINFNYKYVLKSDPNYTKIDSDTRQIYVLDGAEGAKANSYWYFSNIANRVPHIVFHSSNSYTLNNKIPVILNDRKISEAYYSFIPSYLNYTNNAEYRVSEKPISSFKTADAFNLNLFEIDKQNIQTIKHNNQEYQVYKDYQINVDKYVNNNKVNTNKYQVYQINDSKNFIIAHVFYDLKDAVLENEINEIPFQTNKSIFNNSYKRYLDEPYKKNAKFIKYQYVDQNGNYKDLPKENNKYYLSYDILKELQTPKHLLNYIGHEQYDHSYNTPIIIKPVFLEEKVEDLKIEIVGKKDEFLATTKLDPNEFELKITTDNKKEIYITPSKITYQNQDDCLRSNHNHLFLEFIHNNKTYEHKLDIKKVKKMVYDDLTLTNTNLEFNNKYQHPSFIDNLDTSILKATYTDQKDVGEYEIKLEIINPDYIFKNNQNSITHKWSILKSEIKEPNFKNNTDIKTINSLNKFTKSNKTIIYSTTIPIVSILVLLLIGLLIKSKKFYKK
ncbi:C1 family peptidase [Mycoplasma capricolum]|uniref:C1 family peptidase n=1 Tax=Mycoplasma capricolum TaxID=2095 RepID=UPI003DA2C781